MWEVNRVNQRKMFDGKHFSIPISVNQINVHEFILIRVHDDRGAIFNFLLSKRKAISFTATISFTTDDFIRNRLALDRVQYKRLPLAVKELYRLLDRVKCQSLMIVNKDLHLIKPYTEKKLILNEYRFLNQIYNYVYELVYQFEFIDKEYRHQCLKRGYNYFRILSRYIFNFSIFTKCEVLFFVIEAKSGQLLVIITWDICLYNKHHKFALLCCQIYKA